MGTVEHLITIPYAPRLHQLQIHEGMWVKRWGVVVAHRRFGKSVAFVNHLVRAAVTCTNVRGHFGYIAPTYTMAKQIAWEYLKHYTQDIPGRKVNESELWVEFPNQARVRLYGADNPDSLRGIYLDGVVMDEYGQMKPGLFPQVIRPALADRQGWALFGGTPNGKNDFWDKVREAQANTDDWYLGEFRVSQTQILPESELASARKGMTSDEFAQEFECSFEASVRGAIYGSEIAAAKAEGRIGRVSYDSALPVDTIWDLGIGDAMSVIFAQRLGSERRIIDYFEASGEGLDSFVRMLHAKPYIYGKHFAPHDIMVRELSSGKSRYEIAEKLGIRFEVVANIGLEDGINAARMAFGRCWFDEVKADRLIEALQNYRRDYNTKLGEFKATPVHDWSSHGADAFRYFCLTEGKARVVERDIWGAPHGMAYNGGGEGAWMS